MAEIIPKIKITSLGGNCPVQAEGTVNGEEFYFRARGNRWSMGIGGDDTVGEPMWEYSEAYKHTEPYAAGWMSEDEARLFIAKAASYWASGYPSE